LSNLQILYLHSNQLTGSIPADIGNLSNLQQLHLYSNQLSGSIPDSIGDLSNLQHLHLFSNQLIGEIPVSLKSLTSLDPANTNIGYNGLYSTDAGLTTFLDSRDPDWAMTQTIAPTDVKAVPGSETVTVSWKPIFYTADTGGYRIYIAEEILSFIGPYTLYTQTGDKSASSQLVTGLTNGHSYYFKVETRTYAHANNPNVLDSEFSNIAWATPAAGWINALPLISPNGGESWASGTLQNIAWTTQGLVSDVKLEYSTDNGSNWTTIIASTPNMNSYAWTVPNTPSAACLVRVSDAAGGIPWDVSDAVFAIMAANTLTVTSPNGGESWPGGSVRNITWTTTGTVANVKLEYSTDNGSNWTTIIASTTNTNSYSWTLPVIVSTNCLVRVSDAAVPATSDTSDAAFSINTAPAIQRQALIDLYNATNGDAWTNKTGWKTAPLHTDGFAMPGTENTWFGVTTDTGVTTVIEIRLPENNLVGNIPGSLGNLNNLQQLRLNSNQLTGSIPASLGDLSNLQDLYLYSNGLTGSIPSELGRLSTLGALWISSNQLTGSIPTDLGNMSNLAHLILSSNQLTGSIPASLGDLSNLQQLRLNSNKLSGSIPTSLTNLTNLGSSTLSLDYNALYSADAGLTAFLDSKNPDWASTQTIAPTGVTAAPGNASAEVSWTPIAYTGDTGGYRVFYGTTSGGPYTFFAQTANKSTSSQLVSGLTPGIPYYFVVQTRTDIHANNLNVVDSENSDEATATPFVPSGTLTVTSPNGGEVWAGGSPQAITWTSTGTVGNVIVEYSTNGGGAWTTIIASTANDGTHPWTVPNVPSALCLVRVSETDGSPSDVSDTAFTITTGSDVKEDLVGTWDGQAVYYRNSTSGLWTILASPADLIACGDLFGDGKDDVIGIWASQAGVWAKSSADASWMHLSSTARHIAAGDMNGDGRVDFLGTWDGQGVYYRDSISGVWTQLATPADLITAGDLDGDGTDDLIGIWSGQAGVWVKFSQSGDWTYLGSSASDIATADMNGDGRADLLGTWTGQGVFYRNSMNGVWTQLATPADLIAAGDLDGDGTGDLIGIWAGQAGVWVRYSQTQTWTFIASSARDIDSGKMSTGNWSAGSVKIQEFAWPMGGFAEGPGSGAFVDVSAEGPGGRFFAPQVERRLTPPNPPAPWNRIPGPGESGFRCGQQQNLIPGQGGTEKKK
jgi:hypothetical protein